MNYLLDSHTLIWSLFHPEKLTNRFRTILENSGNEIHVSHVSFWEISLKHSLGKIDLPKTTPEELPDSCRENGFKILSLNENDVSTFYKLPQTLHKDPFDRMLTWQAINRSYFFVSKDRSLIIYENFGLKLVW